jgi:hypothetical protein
MLWSQQTECRFDTSTMKTPASRKQRDEPKASLASPFLYALGALAIFLTSALFSAAMETDTTDQPVSRVTVTKMPAFTVDEAVSPKTHSLFMGADIAIDLDRTLYKVTDVNGSDWVVNIDGRSHEISAKTAPLNLRITPNLKVTEVNVTIEGFKRVQAYSFDNDPSVLLTRGLSRSSALNSDLLANSQNAQHRLDTMQNHALGGASLLAGSDDQFSANAQLTTAQFAYSNSHPTILDAGGLPLPSPNAPSTNTNTTGYVGDLPGMQIFATPDQKLSVGIAQQSANSSANQLKNGDEAVGKIASSGLDAMDVEFDIRSKKILHDPYVVTMTRFRTKDSKPGMVQNMVFAKSLHPIDEHRSHVHFIEEGFPSGYELLDFQLHIYNRGEEVATNISADRVELTRDEAFEYVKLEYLGSHKRATAPAIVAMGKLPSDLPELIKSGAYQTSFYAHVSKEGYADGSFSDAQCTKMVTDQYLENLVRNLRFKPALENGKVVEGIAEVNLPKLLYEVN